MKILHFITLADLGGAQSVVLNLARKSVEDGDEVMVVSSCHKELWEKLPQNVNKVRLKQLKREINPKDFLVFFKLKKIYRSFRPDVIHLHSSKAGVLGRLAFPSSKIIYTVHGFDSIRLAFRKFLPLERFLQQRCRAIVAVSNYDAKNLESEGIKENINVIYNGTEDFSEQEISPSEAKDLLEQFSSEKKKIVISIARLKVPKRFDVFCKVAVRFLEKHDIVFVWIGNRNPPENPIPGNVVMLGEVLAAAQLLKYADVFTLFSDFEGMPMSIAEALSLGCPVIASDVGGISEMINKANGFLVSNDHIDFICDSLFKLIENRDVINKMGVKARNTFDEKFQIAEMYHQYKVIYSKINGSV